jgi:hypothetical protein
VLAPLRATATATLADRLQCTHEVHEKFGPTHHVCESETNRDRALVTCKLRVDCPHSRPRTCVHVHQAMADADRLHTKNKERYNARQDVMVVKGCENCARLQPFSNATLRHTRTRSHTTQNARAKRGWPKSVCDRTHTSHFENPPRCGPCHAYVLPSDHSLRWGACERIHIILVSEFFIRARDADMHALRATACGTLAQPRSFTTQLCGF